jgi:hypothetical protein
VNRHEENEGPAKYIRKYPSVALGFLSDRVAHNSGPEGRRAAEVLSPVWWCVIEPLPARSPRACSLFTDAQPIYGAEYRIETTENCALHAPGPAATDCVGCHHPHICSTLMHKVEFS